MATRPQRHLTYDDYARFPDDGRRWELIDGEAYMVPGPDREHQDVTGRLYRRIADFLDLAGGGRVFIAPFDVVFSEDDVFQPDVIFICDEDMRVLTPKNVQGVPTWLIEVVSDPVRDKRVKRDKYIAYGVREYWALDPELRNVEVHRPDEEAFIVSAPGRLSPHVLQDLTLDLDDILGPDVRPRIIR
jgi:Uma2 family endonuclease